MAQNRIQFQPGMSIPEFIVQYGTQAQCEAALEHARRPHGFRCPCCDSAAFAYRFNRRFDLATLPQRLLIATVHCGRRPERELRAAEDSC